MEHQDITGKDDMLGNGNGGEQLGKTGFPGNGNTGVLPGSQGGLDLPRGYVRKEHRSQHTGPKQCSVLFFEGGAPDEAGFRAQQYRGVLNGGIGQHPCPAAGDGKGGVKDGFAGAVGGDEISVPVIDPEADFLAAADQLPE